MATGPGTSSAPVKWELVIIFICTLIMFMCLAAALIPETVEASLTAFFEGAVILSRIAGVVFSAILAITVVYRAWLTIETMLTRRAERHKLEHEADITAITAPANEQVFIHERSGKYRNLTLTTQFGILSDEVGQPTEAELRAWLLYHSLHSTRSGAARGEIAPLLETAEQPLQLMNELQYFDRALIVGASGAGKTTVLQHIVSQRPGNVLIIDPHDDMDTWPERAQVVGGGQKWDLIEKILFALAQEVERRYRHRATGTHPQFADLSVIIDEWFDITQERPDTGRYMQKILTGGRKINTACIIGSHSERVKPLGIEGAGDLKNNFVVVRLKGNKRIGYSATIDAGNGEAPVLLPGPFHVLQPATPQIIEPASKEPLLIDPGKVELPMTPQEARIVSLWDRGERRVTIIGERIYGSRGGEQNKLVRETLAKYGRM